MNAEWESRFGAIRQAKDRDLLADCERRIALEERPIPDTIKPMPPIALNDEEINRIARAFGRPPNANPYRTSSS